MQKAVLRIVLLCPAGREDAYIPVIKWIAQGAVYMIRDDEKGPPLTEKEKKVVGCNLFPLGLHQSLLESRDRE